MQNLSHVDINPSRQTQAVYFVRGYTAPSAIHQVWLKCLQLDIQHKPFPLGMDNHFVLAIFWRQLNRFDKKKYLKT